MRRSGLEVSALDLGGSGPGSSPGQEHCVVSLGQDTLHVLSLCRCMGTSELNAGGGNPAMD